MRPAPITLLQIIVCCARARSVAIIIVFCSSCASVLSGARSLVASSFKNMHKKAEQKSTSETTNATHAYRVESVGIGLCVFICLTDNKCAKRLDGSLDCWQRPVYTRTHTHKHPPFARISYSSNKQSILYQTCTNTCTKCSSYVYHMSEHRRRNSHTSVWIMQLIYGRISQFIWFRSFVGFEKRQKYQDMLNTGCSE